MSVLNNNYFRLKTEFEVQVDIKYIGNNTFSYTIDSSNVATPALKELKTLLYFEPKSGILHGVVKFYGNVPDEFGD